MLRAHDNGMLQTIEKMGRLLRTVNIGMTFVLRKMVALVADAFHGAYVRTFLVQHISGR